MANFPRKIRTFLPQRIGGPIALLYDKLVTHRLLQFHHMVACEIDSHLSCGKVLDIGTGPGQLLVELAKRNPALSLVGLDLSKTMLKIAEKLISDENRGSLLVARDSNERQATSDERRSIKLVRADVRNLPFCDGEFDLVVSTLSLHHWRDPARAIQECLRVTAPKGRCWIYDLRTDVPAKIFAKLVTGKGFGHLFMTWIFKFHGVDPEHYNANRVSCWLGGDAKVQVDVQETYMKLTIYKNNLCEQRNKQWVRKSHS